MTRKRRFFQIDRSATPRDVDSELAFHVEMRAEELVRHGVDPGVAREEALRRFGDLQRVRAECEVLEHDLSRHKTRIMVLSELLQDIRLSVRSLKRSPSFTLTVVLALALGIGSNAAIFGVVNAFLYRPLPVYGADRLAVVAQISRGSTLPGSVSYRNFEDVARLTNVVEDAVLFQTNVVSARARDWNSAERMYLDLVSDNYFSALRVSPHAGSMFSPDAAHRREPLIVLSHHYWLRRFQGDRAIVGQRIQLNGSPYTVAGVAEKRFTGTEPAVMVDAYIPFSTISLIDPNGEAQLTRRDYTSSRMLIRLRPGVQLGAARAALNTLATQLEKEFPAEFDGVGFVTAMETSARPDISVAHVLPWLAGVFMGLTALVLLVACVNVTNLMLARANTRQGELAIRRALGASNMRIVRQMFAESLVLAILALVGGLVLSRWIIAWFASIRIAVDFPVSFNIVQDWRVLVFAAVVALMVAFLTAALPALSGRTSSLSETLRGDSRGGTAAVSRRRVQSALVVAQIAVSLVLLISAGLFIRSVRAAAQTDLGFRPANLMLMSADFTPLRYSRARRHDTYRQLQAQAVDLPSVTSAALSRDIPMGGNNSSFTAYFDEDLPSVEKRSTDVSYNVISPRYFETMGMRVIAGREFTNTDRDSAQAVAIINEEMARKFWPGRDPLLQRFRLSRDSAPVLVVGVVANTRYVFLNEAPMPYAYLPLAQRSVDAVTLHMRTQGAPTAVTAGARALFQNISPDLSVYDVKTMRTHLDDGLAFLFVRLGATLAAAMGVLGIIQAIVGLYGVISYGVTQRTREIGVRLALGASSGRVMSQVLGQGIVLTASGLAIGLVLSLVLTRFMQSLLFGVSPTDLITFAVASVVLAVVALVSAYLPARRAARLEPLLALRSD